MPTMVDPNIVELLLRQRAEPTLPDSPIDQLKQFQYEDSIEHRPLPQPFQDQNAWLEMNQPFGPNKIKPEI